MIIKKAFKYQLKTNPEQRESLLSFSGANRFVWNKALALQKRRLERPEKLERRTLNYNELALFLRLWKESDEWSFLKEAPSQTLQQTLKDLDRAIRDAFNPRQPLKRFPVFKKKHQTKGFRFPQSVKVEGNQVFVPKIGWLLFRKSRAIEGTIKNMTISEKNGHWYVSIQTEIEHVPVKNENASSIGIDLGISKTVSLSNGRIFQGAKSFRKNKNKLARFQRILSRKQRFSNNWKKQKKKISQIHEKIANSRHDRNHWMSTFLVRNYTTIFAEDLSVKNQTKSAKGTTDSPGRMVKQKSGLNRSILDEAWHEFMRQLSYKSEWRNQVFWKVDPKYTSQRCSVCGHTDKSNRESQAKFVCRKCSHSENADINAAKNILAAGHAVFACGGETLVTPKKQEPLVA